MMRKCRVKSEVILKKLLSYVLYAALLWLLIGYIVLPMMNTVIQSFESDSGYGLINYIEFLKNKNNAAVILNTLKLGLCTVVVCGIIGTGLAFYMAFVKVKWRNFVHILFLSPMMVPGVIIVISFIQLYGESGLITKTIELLFGTGMSNLRFEGFGGILFVHAYTQYVYFYLNVSIALKYVDYSTIEAAQGLGATRLKIFRTILLPAVVPALLSSSVVTFISGISSFSAPNLIGGRYKVLSTQILLSKANNFMNIASLQVVILLILGLTVLVVVRYFESRCGSELSVRAVKIKPVKLRKGIASFGLKLTVLCVAALIVLPIAAIFMLSFVKPGTWMIEIFPKEFNLGNYAKLFAKRRVAAPFINSITMSAITVAAGLLITLPLSYVSSKKKSKLSVLSELMIMLPWAMPASTIAVNLINAFNKKNIFAFNQVLVGSYHILPIAYIIMSVPLLMKTNLIAMKSFNTTLEDASKSLGAGWVTTFSRITVPIVYPAVFSGGALIFIRTLGEYTASALIYGVSNRPISIAMVNAMNEFDIGLSMAYGVLTILICFGSMAVAMVSDRKKYS